jgi:hypothetical protein
MTKPEQLKPLVWTTPRLPGRENCNSDGGIRRQITRVGRIRMRQKVEHKIVAEKDYAVFMWARPSGVTVAIEQSTLLLRMRKML